MSKLTNDFGSLVLLAAHASQPDATQAPITTQEIIEEFKLAIQSYLTAPSGQYEKMLLDERIIDKAKILTRLASYVSSQQQNQLFTSKSPITVFRETIDKMENVNEHKAALIDAYLSGQISSSSTPEAQQNEAISTALPQQ